ncbi:O-antigen ligase family protein [Pontibacter silvestris]|uniref:O-antigen ligase family protein n=1 Tax=Pontibacter silvestris TaxID=2305183 RepID=A0ABW4WWP7_9BACT|nr:O-antigen ligase family protein [Pontibacter silvestris]MCC9138829.1 O-antigen ligase family protein [Pontibacter silvestris]
MSQTTFYQKSNTKGLLLPLGIITAVFVGWLTSWIGVALPAVMVVIALFIPYAITVFNNPKVGLISFIIYSFLLFALMRGIGYIPFSVGFEAILLLTWLAALLHNSKQYDWSIIKNDLTFIGVAWFVLTVLEFFNPVGGGSVLAWIGDARYPFLWLLVVPLSMVIFNEKKDLNIFLLIIIGISVLAAFYGIKQLKIGLFPVEKAFLVTSPTHMIFGKLRVFSFYSDAGQFGASMAHLCIIAGVLALGPYKKWKKVACAAASLLFLYGMFISGTRGALFTLAVGIFVVLVINKNVKIIILGLIIALAGFVFLKYTYIGHGNYQIRRMRTALNPEDASLNTRFRNQEKIADYLKSYPMGAGVGSIGFAAKSSHHKTYLATIPPDSYWVKIWASYGIIGLIIWFGMMMYILGKCCGIVWNVKDKDLKFKLTALTAGAAGIFFCSYGNEVINNMPSSMIVYISWAFVFLGPKLDSNKQSKLSATYE